MEDITFRSDNLCNKVNSTGPTHAVQREKKEVMTDVDQIYNRFREFVYSVYGRSPAQKSPESDQYIINLKSTSLEGFLAEGLMIVNMFKVTDARQFAQLVLSQTELDSVFDSAAKDEQEMMMKYCGYFFDLICVVS